MISAKDRVRVFFLSEESFSLFSGDFASSRFGGAGLQMFFLGEEISKDPQFAVTFVFFNHDIAKLQHDRIDFAAPQLPIKRGLPLLSRRSNQGRKARPYIVEEEKKVLFTTMAYYAKAGLGQAQIAQAKSVFRAASDTDVSMPRHVPQGETADTVLDMIASFDKIVVQSRKQHELLRACRQKKSIVIPNGIPLNGSICEVEKEVPKDIILWVGSAQAIKQPWLFVSAAKRFSQENFVMIMPDTSPEISYVVRDMASSLNNIEIINKQLSYRETMGYFARSKIFVNTSFQEGFPNTFLQAGATKTPIVSWRVDPDEVLVRNEFGLVSGSDNEVLYANIESLLNEKVRREALGENAFSYVSGNHSIEFAAEQYKELFRSSL